MKTRKKGFIYWAPRVLGIIMVLFIAMFSLDVFDMPGTAWEKIGGLLIHNIPSFVLIILLIVSWKWELVGAIIYPLLGLAYSLTNLTEHWSVHAVISAPVILIGVLFLLSWLSHKRQMQPI